MSGPLQGLKVVEMPAVGPIPFCGMLLADSGADVLRIDRPGSSELGIPVAPRFDVLGRGKRSLVLDLKAERPREQLIAIVAKADVLIEGFRPGTMEKLGLGPNELQAVNPRLVYGRMTGWGQGGPMASVAGHDINYLALTGALHAIGPRNEAPVPPLNLVADFGGGAMYLAFGVLAALQERQRSGCGQVIDAAMVDGAASLMMMQYGLLAAGEWADERGVNLLDGGAPWYATYACADGLYVAVGALERKFFVNLLRALAIEPDQFPDHLDRSCWPQIRSLLSVKIRSQTRDELCAALDRLDCCVTPVRSMTEAPSDPHLGSRATFIDRDDVRQPAPAPRFSRSHVGVQRSPPAPGEGGHELLREWGVRDA